MSNETKDYLLTLNINIADTEPERRLIQQLLHGSDEERTCAEEAIKLVVADALVEVLKQEAIKKGL